jgi:hypothetical protein
LVNAADPVQAWTNTPRDRRLVIDRLYTVTILSNGGRKGPGRRPGNRPSRCQHNTSLAHLPPGVLLMWCPHLGLGGCLDLAVLAP